ncbi:MAG TPA: hypothetical protein VEW74_04050 [Candidatus Nitrosotalea sp.]|nr:hypothetical protein [Candidatus Nitrosotalea sp.]
MGTLAAVVAGAGIAFLAIRTAISAFTSLERRKASHQFDSFLNACAFVDDEATFARSYAVVLRNARNLERAYFTRDRKSLVGLQSFDPSLAGAVSDVLTTLEQIGTMFRFATNEYAANGNMIGERTADIVIGAHDTLAFVIAELRQDDPRALANFEALYEYCRRRCESRILVS